MVEPHVCDPLIAHLIFSTNAQVHYFLTKKNENTLVLNNNMCRFSWGSVLKWTRGDERILRSSRTWSSAVLLAMFWLMFRNQACMYVLVTNCLVWSLLHVWKRSQSRSPADYVRIHTLCHYCSGTSCWHAAGPYVEGEVCYRTSACLAKVLALMNVFNYVPCGICQMWACPILSSYVRIL